MSRTTRQAALDVLTSNIRIDTALSEQLQKDQFSAMDAALCTHIVYGVAQNRMLLDYYIQAYCTQKVEHLQPPLADILRIGAYQILFLDKIPNHAAVDESVKLTRYAGKARASGLVNAVLRQIVRNKEKLPPLPKEGTEKYLSLRYSHPLWLVRRLINLIGKKETESFLKANQSVPPVTVQVNSLRSTPESLIEELSENHACPHEWIPDCLELYNTGNITMLSAFQEGKFFVQDAAARLVTLVAGIKAGQSVIDVCAAPGGKSFSAAIAMKNQGFILACDLHGNKLERIQAGAKRLGLSIISTEAADARTAQRSEQFDVAIVDAPCSGIGVIRKKPDIRYKSEKELAGLPRLQLELLENTAHCVRSGGLLVYSTCTILPEENQHIINTFLKKHTEFSLKPFSLPKLGEIKGQITLWSQRHNTDGFYICCMKRRIQ